MIQIASHVAEHLQPILTLREELASRWTLALDQPRARGRLASGQVAFDPLEVIGAAGDLVVPFMRVTATFERCGLATTDEALAVRGSGFRILPLLVSWLAGEPLPIEHVRRLARLAAAVLGNSILVRAAGDVRAGLEIEDWSRADCPCCGSAPEFAVQSARGRRFVCSHCDTSWPATDGCAGCGASDAPAVARVPSPELGFELTICNACGRYLKERIAVGATQPLLDRLLTTELDAAAQHRGLRL
ncbi:MAG TPA: formate dehydrogenase accessory protein FdhE [Gemmatimonadaceae bacterium]|nr:formate dehydrogenase accessory protein FdhE [Gemmatimonadaceae bacterium]